MSFFRRAGADLVRFFKSAVDPVAVANEYKLYAKTDGNGDSQIYGRSDDGIVYQISASPLLLNPRWQSTGPVTLAAGLTSDWDPFAGANPTEVVFVTPDPAGSQVDGMLADYSGSVPINGAKRTIVQSGINHGQITILNAEGSVSAVANRFYLDSESNIVGSGITLGHRQGATFLYNADRGAWQLLSCGSGINRKIGITGRITDTALGAAVNDYAPAGIQYTTVLRLASTGTTALSGILGQSDGDIIMIFAFSGGITLLHNSGLSAAGNRFLLPTSLQAGGLLLENFGSVTLKYDAPNSAWMMQGRSP